MNDLKEDFNSENHDVMKEIQKYVKLEANKTATVKLVEKLLRLSSEKKACFLCKRDVNSSDLSKMNKLFSVESFENNDEKIDFQK